MFLTEDSSGTVVIDDQDFVVVWAVVFYSSVIREILM